MRKTADYQTRSLMVLQEEAERAYRAAERVRLVVQAMASKRGVAPVALERDPDFNFGA